MRSRNLYVVALWTLGAGLTLGGASAIWWRVNLQFQESLSRSNPEWWILQVLDVVASPMVFVGLATLVGSVALHARSRRPRPNPRPK